MKYRTSKELIEFINSLSNSNYSIKEFEISLVIENNDFENILKFFTNRNIKIEVYEKDETVIIARFDEYNLKIKLINNNEKSYILTPEEEEYLTENKVDLKLYSETRDEIFNFNKLVGSERLISMRKHTRFVEFPRHRHDYIELIYVKNGSLTNNVNNDKIVMKAGDIFLMNQEVYHSIDKTSYEDEIYNFLIHPNYFKVLIRLLHEDKVVSKFLIKALNNHDNNIAEYVYFKYNNNEETVLLFERLIKMFDDYEKYRGKIKIIVGYILCNLIEDKESYEIVHYNNYDIDTVTLIQSYIVQNFKDASLEELASRLNMKSYQLSKMIKKEMGQSFIDMLKKEKMYNAAKLLKSTDLSVEEIAGFVGYNSVSHFFKQFKNFYDITPNEYREEENAE